MGAVTLSWWEAREVLNSAYVSSVYNRAHGRDSHRHGLVVNDIGHDVDLRSQGLLAERAVAKLAGAYHDGLARGRHDGDLPNGWEVRGTTNPRGRLIVHPDDPDDATFWLVTSVPVGVTMVVEGRITGREAKRQEWWTDPTGTDRWAYFVPRGVLT